MRILLANDDGIGAAGLSFLEAAARRLSGDVWVVAPERKWTAASHQLSFDRDIAFARRGDRRFACSGSPADCIVGAMTVLFSEGARPDLVLSGVNEGRNVGEDAAYSGTLAIAREAAFWGIPGIGLSRTKGGSTDVLAIYALSALLEKLWAQRSAWLVDGGWLSVNLPLHLPAPVSTPRIGRDKIAGAADIVERSGDDITWRIRRGRPQTRTEGDENAMIDAGHITVVRQRWNRDDPLQLDL